MLSAMPERKRGRQLTLDDAMLARVRELRSELRVVEQRTDGCRETSCITHGLDVQRAQDIDKQLRKMLK